MNLEDLLNRKSANVDTRLTLTDKMTYGKYKGTVIQSIIDDNPSYIDWLIINTGFDDKINEECLSYACSAIRSYETAKAERKRGHNDLPF